LFQRTQRPWRGRSTRRPHCRLRSHRCSCWLRFLGRCFWPGPHDRSALPKGVRLVIDGSLFDLSASTTKFLILSSLLFVIGVGGVLARRNIIVIFMSIELILN